MARPLRRNRLFLAAALVLALTGLPAHSEDPQEQGLGTPKDTIELTGNPCTPSTKQTVNGHGYTYCGLHWRLSKLPVRFVLNIQGKPPSISPTSLIRAAEGAAQAWDVWAQSRGTGPRQQGCATANVVCVSPTTTSMVAANPNDGINVIVWANLPATAAPASALIVYDGQGRISDVDITLNANKTWFSDGPDLATGLAAGAIAFACPVCPTRYDLQSILTHEIGHALGLHHVNPGSSAVWPTDAEDGLDYNMVMYERYYPNNATQRVLQWGDVAGLQVAVEDSVSDP